MAVDYRTRTAWPQLAPSPLPFSRYLLSRTDQDDCTRAAPSTVARGLVCEKLRPSHSLNVGRDTAAKRYSFDETDNAMPTVLLLMGANLSLGNERASQTEIVASCVRRNNSSKRH